MPTHSTTYPLFSKHACSNGYNNLYGAMVNLYGAEVLSISCPFLGHINPIVDIVIRDDSRCVSDAITREV